MECRQVVNQLQFSPCVAMVWLAIIVGLIRMRVNNGYTIYNVGVGKKSNAAEIVDKNYRQDNSYNGSYLLLSQIHAAKIEYYCQYTKKAINRFKNKLPMAFLYSGEFT